MRQFFIKTFSKLEYAELFLSKGQMLFRNFKYFRKIEDNKQRGDESEGLAIEQKNIVLSSNLKSLQIGRNNQGKQFFLDIEKLKNDKPELFNKELTMKISYYADCILYCLTYIDSNTKDIDLVFNRIKNYGEYSVVITNCKDFLEKVKTKILGCECKFVKYNTEKDKKDVFNKPVEYKYDNEFRIVKNSSDDSEFIEIGKLQGFICKSESLNAIKSVL